MRAHPDLVGGPDGADFHLMRTAPGWFAKGGAEGLLCAGGPNGLGIALKSEDGAAPPLGPALAAFLEPFGVALPASHASRSRTPAAISSASSRSRLRDTKAFLYEPVTQVTKIQVRLRVRPGVGPVLCMSGSSYAVVQD